MLAFTVILEDIQIHGHRENAEDRGGTPGVSFWHCRVGDGMGGSEDITTFTDEQMGAILALAIGGDEQCYSKMMYAIAEPAIEMLAPELRMIP